MTPSRNNIGGPFNNLNGNTGIGEIVITTSNRLRLYYNNNDIDQINSVEKIGRRKKEGDCNLKFTERLH